MARTIDLNDYTEVGERVRAFYDRYPGGSIRTELVLLEDDLVIFKALVYRDPRDPHPTTGWAYERVGSSPVDPARFLENCETSAVGRALANRNLAGPRRPSREEMEKVRRMRRDLSVRGRGDAPPSGEGTSGPGPAARIRRLLGQLRLSASKRTRIEARLEAGLSEQEARDLEAYLLALLPRAS